MRVRFVRSLLVSFVAAVAVFYAGNAEAQWSCDPNFGFTIEMSPAVNPPGPLPNGQTSSRPWTEVAAGQSKTYVIRTTMCGANFPADATQIRYEVFPAGGLSSTPVVAVRTGPATFSDVQITISVAPGTAGGQGIGTIVQAQVLNASGGFTGPNGGKTNFGLIVYVPAAAPPTFQLSVTPDRFNLTQGQSTNVTVTVTSVNGFQGPVEVTTQHSPALLEITPPTLTLNVPANGTVTGTLTIRARPAAPAGSANFIVVARSGATEKLVGVFPTIVAAAPPDFSFAVTPPAASVTAGQTTTVTATITPVNNFTNPVAISVTSPNNAVTASPVTVTSPYSPTPITLQVAPNVQGPIAVTLTATSGALVKTTTITLNVQPAQTPAFDLVVTPANVAITVGQSAAVTVRVVASGGFNSPVTVTSPTVTQPGVQVTFNPQTFTLAPGESRVVMVTASAASLATTAPIALLFGGTSGTLTDTAALTLVVAPAAGGDAPAIQSITPMAYAPMPAQEFIVIGRNFAPGAAVTVQQPERGAIAIVATRYISPTQLGVTLSVSPDAPTGRGYLVTVRNPNGRTTTEQVVLVVAPQGALGGPAAVTRAAIEFPVRGQVISAGKGSIAAAHLATSGSGTIVGRWRVRQRNNGNDPGYVFDQFTATVAGGFLVSTDRPCFDAAGRPKTTAHVCASIPMLHRGTYNLELLVDQPRLVTPASVPITIQSDSGTELTIYRPREASAIDVHDPEFSWTTVPGVAQYNVELVRVTTGDERVLPIVVQTSRSTWRPDMRDLRTRRGVIAGTYRWRVVAVYPGDLRGQVSEWRTITFADIAFTSARHVATVASTDLSMALDQEEPAPEAAERTTMYTLAPNATITATKDASPTGQFSLSSQGELGAETATSKFTGDLNYTAGTDPRTLVQESRNWIIEGGTPDQRAYGLGGQFGYTTPDFTSGAEFLTSGSAQTGVVARARSRFGTLSYYQPVSTAIHGVLSGLEENLEIRSLAFSTPEGRAYMVRLIGLEVEEPTDDNLGVIGSRLRTFGVYGTYALSPALSLVAEVARGNVRPDALSGIDEGRDGTAMRVGLTGTRGTFNYSANVRSTGANFVNPANRGLTPGGVSDRVMLDLNVGKTLGRTMLTFGVRRQDQGRSSESTLPSAHQNGFNLGVTTTLAGISVNVAANYTGDRADANEETFFPATDRDASGISTTFSRAFGRINLSQTLSVQRTSDAINPMTDQTLATVGLMASGTLFANFTLNGSLNGTRARAVAELGTTNAWSAALQPSLAIPLLSLSIQPSISLSRSNNRTLLNSSDAEQYNLSLQWSPNWLGSLVAAQVTSSWSRNGFGGVDGPLTRSYQASLTMRMNKERDMPWFPTGPQPGTVPPAAPDPVQDQSAPAVEPGGTSGS